MMYTAYTTNFLFPCFQYAETGGILLYFSTSINKISAFCLKKKKKKIVKLMKDYLIWLFYI